VRQKVTYDGKPVTLPVLQDHAMALAMKHMREHPVRRSNAGCGRIPADCRFAILTSPAHKPSAFLDLLSLAKRIHRDRAGAALQLANATLFLPGETAGRPTVKVWTLCEGIPHHFLGYCWVGRVQSPREVLQAALDVVQPRRFEEAAA
jgi:hypothetical protein